MGKAKPEAQVHAVDLRSEVVGEGGSEEGWAAFPESRGQYARCEEEEMKPRIRIRQSKTGAVRLQKPRLPKTGKPNMRKMRGLPRI